MARAKRTVGASEKALRGVLAANIAAHMAAKNWTVQLFADNCDISRAMAYELLGRRRSATTDMLARMAEALSVEPWMLIRPYAKGGGLRRRVGPTAQSSTSTSMGRA